MQLFCSAARMHSGHHQTAGIFYKTNDILKYHFTSHIHRSGNPDRSRTVVVPNVGGFAGASFNFSNAKVSLGYRADFFFGAMDGGIDTAKSENRGFYGPFAIVSVGFGGSAARRAVAYGRYLMDGSIR